MNQKDLFDNLTKDATLTQIQDYIKKVAQMRGFAGQAVPELKEIAAAIIGSNDEDDVAKWLEENVF